MEIVIIEKKTFEALLSGVGTLTEKVNTLYRRCGVSIQQTPYFPL